MSISYSAFSSTCEPLLALLGVFLQLITLCTSWWAEFAARTDLGKPEEKGHYGLWTLCSTKGPHWREDCDPLDTFFESPPYVTVSGFLCVFNLLLLVIFVPLGFLKILQVCKNKTNFCIKSKRLRMVIVTLALLSTLVDILVVIFASINENSQKEYLVVKGWSFWIQIAIIMLNIALLTLSSTEFYKFLKLQWQQQIDPEGKRAETYGNPSFDADSPTLPRSHPPSNGAIAFTESSGFPFGQNLATNGGSNDSNSKTSSGNKSNKKDSFETLTYANECFMESSPRSERRQQKFV